MADELTRLTLDAALEPNLLVAEVTERSAAELDVYEAMVGHCFRATTAHRRSHLVWSTVSLEIPILRT